MKYLTLTATLALPLVALLSACAGSPYAESKKFDRLRSFEEPEFGYVVASVGKKPPGNRFDATEVLFQLRSTDDRGALTYAPKAFLSGASPKDIDTPDVEATVVVKRLPPGTYDVYLAKGISNAGGTWIYNRPLVPPMSFTITTGRTTYVARFLIGQDGFGPSTAATLHLSAEPEMDLAIAQKRVSGVNREGALTTQAPAKR